MNDDRARLTLLRERLELGLATARRPRALAVLSIRVHERGGGPATGVTAARSEQVERAVRGCLSATDSLARLEGLRFVALLEREVGGSFAMHAADRVVQAVAEAQLAASVGISVHPDDGDEVDELIRCADAAAEAAELGGGDLFGYYSEPLNARAHRRTEIERALVGALDRDELYLVYQPQLDTRDGTLVGVEALLRFESEKLGMVPPDEFIPVLESTGGIQTVGAWALERAAVQAAAWARGGRPVRVGVNVSARQVAAASFEATVAHALERASLDPRLLELELTESVLLDNPVETRRRIEAVRSLGVHVALDDFGTGFASLSYLRQFPMDGLKIDRQFVRGLPLDAEAAAITSAIASLAHSLRLGVVAEGVETEAEEEFLHAQQCFVVQGYLHARPMKPEALDAWRSSRPWT